MFRSLLYVPVTEQRFIDKLTSVRVDGVILDLEDSIAMHRKEQARSQLLESVRQVRSFEHKVLVRVNHQPGLLMPDIMAAWEAGVDTMVIPKVRDTDVLDALSRHLAQLPSVPGVSRPRFFVLIEDAVGLLNAQKIAFHPDVFGVSLGTEDFATSIDARPTPEVIRIPKLMVHYAAKAAGKLSLGLLRSVADYRDTEAMEASIREAAEFGFDGASCIHPSVVGLLNAGFSATPQALDKATRLLEAAQTAHKQGLGAFTFEGEFVDEPIIERARRLIERNQS